MKFYFFVGAALVLNCGVSGLSQAGVPKFKCSNPDAAAQFKELQKTYLDQQSQVDGAIEPALHQLADQFTSYPDSSKFSPQGCDSWEKGIEALADCYARAKDQNFNTVLKARESADADFQSEQTEFQNIQNQLQALAASAGEKPSGAQKKQAIQLVVQASGVFQLLSQKTLVLGEDLINQLKNAELAKTSDPESRTEIEYAYEAVLLWLITGQQAEANQLAGMLNDACNS